MAVSFRRRVACVAAAVLSVVLVAAGCSGSSPSADSANSTLVIYDGRSGQFTVNFNPFSPVPLNAAWGMIYQPLMFVNLARAGDVQPLLATKYQWSPDGRTLTFTLRSGVQWSDGTPLTADDVVYVFDVLEKNPKINTYSVPYAGATKIDATHVAVNFTEPAFNFSWYVLGKTFIVPKHIWTKIADPATTTNPNPVGSGPFTLSSFNAQSFDLKRNPHYWDPGKPKVATVRYVSFTGNQPALNALLGGQVDWEGGFIADIDKTYVAKNPSANKYINTPQYITVLVPNFDAGPTRDLAVREAIYYGMDRDQINKLAFSGYDTPSTPGLVLLPRDARWLAPDIAAQPPTYDQAKAENFLKQAGYTKGSDGIYVSPKGVKLTIGVKVVAGYSDWIEGLQVIKQQLARIGIDIEPQIESFSAYSVDEQNGTFDMHITNIYGGPEPSYMYNDFLDSVNTKPIGQQAVHNYARFRDPVVDQALTVIAGTNDDNVKKQEYSIIEHEAMAQLPYIPIMQSSSLTEFNVGKFTGWPTQNNLYALPMPFAQPDMGVVAADVTPVG